MPSERRRQERGSVLLLVPAAVLVVLILGAVAVDAAVVFLGQRELNSAVAAAANDAAATLADGAFYEGGRVEIDAAAAQRVAAASLAARTPRGLDVEEPLEVIVVGRQICVRARALVRRVFAPGIPGARDSAVVTAVAAATLARAPDDIPPAPC